MSPRVTQARSKSAATRAQKPQTAPYFLRSRVPLGNASNLIGLERGVEVLKKPKAARAKKQSAKSNCEAKEKEKTPEPVPQAPDCAAAAAVFQADSPQCFSSLLLQEIQGSGDAADAQMCCEYERDIYTYLQHLEVALSVRPCYLQGQQVSAGMRALALDWLMQVQREFRLQPETLFMTVGIIDRFLQSNPVPKQYLQLVCVTAMLLSCKYEEVYPPTVGDFAFVTDGAYSCGDVRRMERIILKRLDYSLGRPNPLHFLQRACRVSQASAQHQSLAQFLLEVSVLDSDLLHVPPSLLAAAAFAESRRILDSGERSLHLQHQSGYSAETLTPVMLQMENQLKKISSEHALQEIHSRYQKQMHMARTLR